MTLLAFNQLNQNNIYILAEAGCNHNGDMLIAERLIEEAIQAGANAVKFQSFSPEFMITRNAPKAEYQIRATGTSESQYQRLCRLQLTRQDHLRLQRKCLAGGITFLSSPFDHQSVDLLAELDIPLIKIPSGEITNLPLLAHIASLGKPVILSTGMSSLGEIERALEVLSHGCGGQVAILHCVSDYPADWSQANLFAIPTLRKAFGVPVGFSDHTLGLELSLVAVALGAVIIEKHFTLDRRMEGGDHLASLEPLEFAKMVHNIRNLGPALGDGRKACQPCEKDVRSVARKSIVAANFIRQGEVLTLDNLACKRPGIGLSPSWLDQIVGRRALRDLEVDHQLELGDF